MAFQSFKVVVHSLTSQDIKTLHKQFQTQLPGVIVKKRDFKWKHNLVPSKNSQFNILRIIQNKNKYTQKKNLYFKLLR